MWLYLEIESLQMPASYDEETLDQVWPESDDQCPPKRVIWTQGGQTSDDGGRDEGDAPTKRERSGATGSWTRQGRLLPWRRRRFGTSGLQNCGTMASCCFQHRPPPPPQVCATLLPKKLTQQWNETVTSTQTALRGVILTSLPDTGVILTSCET